MRTMNRAAAVAIVARFAFNFAISHARTAVEDAIDSVPYDRLGWYEMSQVYRKVLTELQERETFYLWSVSGVDHDEFIAAKWALGEDVVMGAVRAQFKCMSADSLEMLGQAKLERKQAEAKRENIDA